MSGGGARVMLHLLMALATASATSMVAGAAAPLPATSSPVAGPDRNYTKTVEVEGIRIAAEISPLNASRKPGEYREGDSVEVTFHISDTTTGTPLPGLFPGAWMDLVPDKAVENSKSCKEKIEGFVGGSLLSVPEVNLNVYYVLALNPNATISVVDPLFGFGGSKLLSMIDLASPGYDWVSNENDTRVYVSMPESGRIAVIDTSSWKVTAEIETGGQPSRLGLQPDGRYLWVGDASGPGVTGIATAVVDLATHKVVARVGAGAGNHHFAFTQDSRYAFVLSEQAGTLSAIDIPPLKPIARLKVGEHPVSIAYSAVADTVYVADQTTGQIVAIDARSQEVLTRLAARPGIGDMAIAPNGRLGLVVNPQTDELFIFDTALNRIIQTGDMLAGPDQVSFSDELAYVRHQNSELVLMIPLGQLGREGEPVPVIDFPGGQKPFGKLAKPTAAAGIVQAPGATAVLVANPADQMIYYYKEGMAAPMGSFSNYGHVPRAVMVIDRSLTEKGSSGTYSTAIQLRRPGKYDLAFFLDAPRMTQCFRFQVLPNAELERQRLAATGARVEFLHQGGEVEAGREVTVQFRLSDPLSGEPLMAKDVQVLTFQVPGIWQNRSTPTSLGEGLYELRFVPREAGIFQIIIHSTSLKLALNRAPTLNLYAVDPATPASAASSATSPESRSHGSTQETQP